MSKDCSVITAQYCPQIVWWMLCSVVQWILRNYVQRLFNRYPANVDNMASSYQC